MREVTARQSVSTVLRKLPYKLFFQILYSMFLAIYARKCDKRLRPRIPAPAPIGCRRSKRMRPPGSRGAGELDEAHQLTHIHPRLPGGRGVGNSRRNAAKTSNTVWSARRWAGSRGAPGRRHLRRTARAGARVIRRGGPAPARGRWRDRPGRTRARRWGTTRRRQSTARTPDRPSACPCWRSS